MAKLGKIITVYPVMSGNGGKYMATGIAYSLSTLNKGSKVALVDFDFRNPYLAAHLTAQDPTHNIDNLLERIKTGFLTKELFLDNMVSVEGLFSVLKGTQFTTKVDLITKEHIDAIIKYLKEEFDYIVIAVSSHADNAGTIYGLYNADETVMVIKENIANFKLFPKAIETVERYKTTDKPIKLVYNMRVTDSPLDFNAIAVQKGVVTIAGIPYDEGTIDNMNISAGFVGRMTNKFSTRYNDMMKKTVLAVISEETETVDLAETKKKRR